MEPLIEKLEDLKEEVAIAAAIPQPNRVAIPKPNRALFLYVGIFLFVH